MALGARATRTLIGLLATLAILATLSIIGGEGVDAGTTSIECIQGQWGLKGARGGDPGSNSGIPCDEPKPGWIFGWNSNRIEWVYDGDRVVTPYTIPGSNVVRTTIREVQEQGNKRPLVNQPRATDGSAFLYQADRDNRAVRGADGQCYREQRISGQWRRSGAYGDTAEACRRAAWNAHFRAQRQEMVDPAGGTFPDGPAPSPVLQAGTMGEPGATVNGLTLTLTFNQALDGDSLPAPGAFRVTVNGARRSVATGGVAISGATVKLTLTSAVSKDDTVRVSYTKPSANPLRGALRVPHLASSFPVESFSNQAVTNNTPIWSATLTVAELVTSTSSYYGCFLDHQGKNCSDMAVLTSSSFVSGGTSYTVVSISRWRDNLERFSLTLDKAIPEGWTLHIGNQEFSVAGATLSSSKIIASWTNPNFTWTANQKVQISLTVSE